MFGLQKWKKQYRYRTHIENNRQTNNSQHIHTIIYNIHKSTRSSTTKHQEHNINNKITQTQMNKQNNKETTSN